MLERGHGDRYKAKYPTYEEVSVCKDWHLFSNFKAWMEKQDWENKELDKDILYPGNKVYSPETCCFVSKEINYLLSSQSKKKSGLLPGVSHDKNGRFSSYLSARGKQTRLGRFDTELEAHVTYVKAKIQHVESIISDETDKRIVRGLSRHVALMREALMAKGQVNKLEVAAWTNTN